MRAKLVLAALALSGLAGCASVGPAPNTVPADIANATTAADHHRIADHFTHKAGEYDAEAARHDATARSYAGAPRAAQGAMASHCRNMRDQFAAASKEARALAQAHRDMAK